MILKRLQGKSVILEYTEEGKGRGGAPGLMGPQILVLFCLDQVFFLLHKGESIYS